MNPAPSLPPPLGEADKRTDIEWLRLPEVFGKFVDYAEKPVDENALRIIRAVTERTPAAHPVTMPIAGGGLLSPVVKLQNLVLGLQLRALNPEGEPVSVEMRKAIDTCAAAMVEVAQLVLSDYDTATPAASPIAPTAVPYQGPIPCGSCKKPWLCEERGCMDKASSEPFTPPAASVCAASAAAVQPTAEVFEGATCPPDEYARNLLESCAGWLESCTGTVWATQFHHSHLMKTYARDLRIIRDKMLAAAPTAGAVQLTQCSSCDLTDNDSQRCSDCPKRVPRWYPEGAVQPTKENGK